MSLARGLNAHRKRDCLCGKCQEDNRYFANALRNWLGLPPLFMDGRSKAANYRVHYHHRRYTPPKLTISQ